MQTRTGKLYPHISDILRRYDRPGQMTIEIGCGGNQYGRLLQGRHLGTDLPHVHYAGAPPAVFCDGRWLPFRNGSADLVFMVAVLYHIAEADAVLAECHRVLKSHGRLLIFDYNRATTRRLHRSGAAALTWSPRTLRARVRAAGFEAASIWEYAVDSPNRWKRVLLRMKTIRYLRHVAPFNEGWNIVVGTRTDGA